MDKTREEILEHLINVGYDNCEQGKIMAYLYGKGVIELNEDVKIQNGENDFEFFVDWCENDTDFGILLGLFDDVCERAISSKTLSEMERYIRQIDFLIDTFGLSKTAKPGKDTAFDNE